MHTVATHRVYGFNKKRLSLNFAGDRGLQKGLPDLLSLRPRLLYFKRRVRFGNASLPAEFPSQVLNVDIVLTGRLDDVAIRRQVYLFLNLPRLGINLRVVDRNLNFHVPEVRPPETLDDVQGIGSGLARLIQPCLSVETACIDDQGVAIPLAGGIT